MKIGEVFQSRFLRAADLAGRERKVVIDSVETEELDGKTAMIAHFRGAKKALVVNKTNALAIGEVLGEETDKWLGHEVVLFTTKVPFNGRMVDAIRVRVDSQSTQQNDAPAQGSADSDDVFA